MNANELADKLEQGHWEGGTREQAATMLRQQKAEYYSLLVNHDKLYAKVVEQQAEIEMLKTKTLTISDRDILKIIHDKFTKFGFEADYIVEDTELIDFARAILRKAQE